MDEEYSDNDSTSNIDKVFTHSGLEFLLFNVENVKDIIISKISFYRNLYFVGLSLIVPPFLLVAIDMFVDFFEIYFLLAIILSGIISDFFMTVIEWLRPSNQYLKLLFDIILILLLIITIKKAQSFSISPKLAQWLMKNKRLNIVYLLIWILVFIGITVKALVTKEIDELNMYLFMISTFFTVLGYVQERRFTKYLDLCNKEIYELKRNIALKSNIPKENT